MCMFFYTVLLIYYLDVFTTIRKNHFFIDTILVYSSIVLTTGQWSVRGTGVSCKPTQHCRNNSGITTKLKEKRFKYVHLLYMTSPDRHVQDYIILL